MVHRFLRSVQQHEIERVLIMTDHEAIFKKELEAKYQTSFDKMKVYPNCAIFECSLLSKVYIINPATDHIVLIASTKEFYMQEEYNLIPCVVERPAELYPPYSKKAWKMYLLTTIGKNLLSSIPLLALLLALTACTTPEERELNDWIKNRNAIERVRSIQNQYKSTTYNSKY